MHMAFHAILARMAITALSLAIPAAALGEQGSPPSPAQRESAAPEDGPIDLGADKANRLTLPVHIAGAGPFPFIIDTGSMRTIVSTELAQQLALTSGGRVDIISMAGPATLDTVRLDHLAFGDDELSDVSALTVNRAHLGGAGLIGLDSLRDKRVVMDFRANNMTIADSRGQRRETHAPDEIIVRARSKLGQLILVDSRVAGQKVSVILDTGAQVSVGNMALFKKLKRERLVVPPQPITLTSVTGTAVQAQYTIVRKIEVGNVTLANVPIVFVDAAPFIELGYKERPAMLLGMEMLQLFDRIAIDFGRREVNFLLPQSNGLRRSERQYAAR